MKITNYISSFWGRFAGSALSELVELFGEKIPLPDVSPLRQIPKGQKVREEYECRDRIFNQWRTFWIFLAQVFSLGQSCSEAIKKAQVWIWLKEKKTSHPTHLLTVKHATDSIRCI